MVFGHQHLVDIFHLEVGVVELQRAVEAGHGRLGIGDEHVVMFPRPAGQDVDPEAALQVEFTAREICVARVRQVATSVPGLASNSADIRLCPVLAFTTPPNWSCE